MIEMDKEIDKKEIRFEPGIKLMSHPEFWQYIDGNFTFPIGIEISPSGRCRAKCPECFYRQEENKVKVLDGILFKESRMECLIEELAGCGVKSISWTGGGNPDDHPAFPKFVEQANWAGIKQGLFTNALEKPKYNPSSFKWIRVTKTNKPLNEDALMELRQCKTLGICINYRGKIDDDDIKSALKVAEKLDELKESSEYTTYVQVRPALKIYGKKVGANAPDIKHPLLELTEYKFTGSNTERHYEFCEAFHFVPFIWQDGDIDVCGYHRKDPEFNLGNLYSEGKKGRFKHIMENAIEKIRVREDCQICCKLNSMNSMTDLAKKIRDRNFP